MDTKRRGINKNKPIPAIDQVTAQSLKQSNQNYLSLMESTGAAIIIVQNGKIKKSNLHMAKMSSYRLEEVVDTCFASFFHCNDVPAVESLDAHWMKNPNNVKVLEAALVCKNGRQIKVEITAARCLFQQKPASLLIIRDVSNRLTANADLQRRQI